MNTHISVEAVCENTAAIEIATTGIDTLNQDGYSAVTTLHLLGDFRNPRICATLSKVNTRQFVAA